MYPQFTIAEGKKVAMPFVCYDKYLDKDESFEDDAIPLLKYLKMRACAASPPCKNSYEADMALPGELLHTVYVVSTEVGKKIARGMLKAIWKNGKTGKCFSDFNVNNIFISREGKVKFKGVKHLVKASIELGIQLRQNYLQARQIILEMFLKAVKGKKIPVDIEHLLNMILNQPAKSELYHIHASLVPQATYWYMYMKMYDHLSCKVNDSIREAILLRLPYLAEWKSKLELNLLLKEVYLYREGQYDVTEAKVAAKLKGKGVEWSLLTAEQKNRKMEVMKAQKFADYLRNRTAHRMEYIPKVAMYTAEGSDMVTRVRFPMVMVRMQEELFDENMMAELLLEQFF